MRVLLLFTLPCIALRFMFSRRRAKRTRCGCWIERKKNPYNRFNERKKKQNKNKTDENKITKFAISMKQSRQQESVICKTKDFDLRSGGSNFNRHTARSKTYACISVCTSNSIHCTHHVLFMYFARHSLHRNRLF